MESKNSSFTFNLDKRPKIGWRKFRHRISEFCYVGGIFTGQWHNTARSASLNSASVGRMKMLQGRKIGRDLARVANLAQLIPASSLPMLQPPSPSSFSSLLTSTDLTRQIITAHSAMGAL